MVGVDGDVGEGVDEGKQMNKSSCENVITQSLQFDAKPKKRRDEKKDEDKMKP